MIDGSQASVSAVVVAFNGGAALRACLDSLLSQTIQADLIVVDNASTDGSVEALEGAFGDSIHIKRRAKNEGYAAGANVGWHAATTDLVAVLNQDLVLMPDCLERMRDVLLASDREALVTPKVVLKSDPTRVNTVGNEVHVSGVASCHGLGTNASAWSGVIEVTTISGAAFMTQRRILEDLDGLEEAYFMYYEDVDLALRARLRGAVCLAACDAVAVHDWDAHISPWKFELLERNRWALWQRLWGGNPRILVASAQAEVMAWLYAALHGPAYLTAKRRAMGGKLGLGRPTGNRNGVLNALDAKHPYAVMFPRRRLVQRVGAFVDRLVVKIARPGAGSRNAS